MAEDERQDVPDVDESVLREDDRILREFMARRPSEIDYLRDVERLAKRVRDAAYEERGARIFDHDLAESNLELALVDLCSSLRSETT